MKRFLTTYILCVLSLFVFVSQAQAKFIPQSEIISSALYVIESRYVSAERLEPPIMLKGALSELAIEFSPIMTKLENKHKHWYVTVIINDKMKTFDIQRLATVSDLNQVIQTIAKYAKENLTEEPKLEKIDYALIKGILKKLDPHSALIVPDDYTEFSMSTSGDYGGVGMVISQLKDKVIALYVLDDSPAKAAGIKPKDQIVRIGEESTLNMFSTEVANKLRGKAGTKVIIQIMRKGFKNPRTVELKRAKLRLKSVYGHVFKRGDARVGYLQIQSFQANTFNQVVQQIDDFDYSLKDFKGMILDLRNNPGGLLASAIAISDLFLKRGVIVSTANAHAKQEKSYNASWFKTLDYFPVLVLVNNGSASAAEILSGALKRNNRAILLGQRTFGKGSVQQIVPLRTNTLLKLTTAQYLTPGNYSIQSVGIEPNITLNPYLISHKELVMGAKKGFSEKDLSSIFNWGSKPEKTELSSYYFLPQKDKKYFYAMVPRYSQKELIDWLDKDQLAQTAVSILLQSHNAQPNTLKKIAIKYVKQQQKVQDKLLLAELAKFHIDWHEERTFKSTGKRLHAQFWFEKKEKKKWVKTRGALKGGGDYRLYGKLTNNSKFTISRIKAVSKSEERWIDGLTMVFGTLKPHKSSQWYYEFSLPKNISTQSKKFAFTFTSHKRRLFEQNLIMQMKNQGTPKFSYTLSASALPVKAEEGKKVVHLHFSVYNKSNITSGKLEFFLRNGEGDKVLLLNGRLSNAPLKPDGQFSGELTFVLKKRPKDNDIDLSVTLVDKLYFEKSFEDKIKIPLTQEKWSNKNTLPYFSKLKYPLVSKKKKTSISFVVNDKEELKDVYLFENNHKILYKNYEQAKNRLQGKVTTQLALKKGMNRIILIARDDSQVQVEKKLFIRY